MQVQDIPISELVQDAANVRTHGARNLETIQASLARFGQQKPIVVGPDGVVVAGNGTLAAARALGWETIRAIRTELKGAERTAYAIADNRTGELAEWDEPALAEQLEALQKEDDELLEAAGFNDDELEQLIDEAAGGGSGEITEDEAPEPPDDPITQPGDLWLLGEHRLFCGDSRNPEHVDQALGSELAAAVITDPPYGVDYIGKTKKALQIKNDGAKGLRELLKAAFSIAVERCREGGAWYVTAPPGPHFGDFAAVLGAHDIWRQTLVWVKDSLVLGRNDYQYQHEPIFYGWKPGGAHKAPPDRKQTSIWEFDRPKASREHPTMKPVGLFAKAMENSTAVGSIVLDPFLGSGTTLIAAEQLGRRCCGLEIDPAFCDVIVKRWETLTGRKAERAGGVKSA